MVVVDSKVPVFSHLNTTSKHSNSESQLEDTRKGLYFSKHTIATHTITEKAGMLIIFKGSNAIPLFYQQ